MNNLADKQTKKWYNKHSQLTDCYGEVRPRPYKQEHTVTND